MTHASLPPGGLPPQNQLATDRAVFTESYAVIPRGCLRDIVTSLLPGWRDARFWVLARPLSGFAETFSYYIGEVAAGGGSTQSEPDETVEAVLYVAGGSGVLSVAGDAHQIGPGSYCYLPDGCAWTLANEADAPLTFHWVRKRYQPAPGIAPPAPFVTTEKAGQTTPMPDSDGAWCTTRFVDPDDLSHDMHVNIVSFAPGGSIPFLETHVMEHGIFILEGKAVYRLNADWVEVEAGDFLWLRAFCPQACVAAGPGPFRYLLYKDVNRHASFGA